MGVNSIINCVDKGYQDSLKKCCENTTGINRTLYSLFLSVSHLHDYWIIYVISFTFQKSEVKQIIIWRLIDLFIHLTDNVTEIRNFTYLKCTFLSVKCVLSCITYYPQIKHLLEQMSFRRCTSKLRHTVHRMCHSWSHTNCKVPWYFLPVFAKCF